jgi:hypothetical protein
MDLDIAPSPVAAFDPPVVRPNQQSIYRVTFRALEESVEWPKRIPGPAGLDLQPGAHGQLLQLTGPTFIPITSFNTRARAGVPGTFTIPGFVVQIYGKPVTIPPATLQVLEAAPESTRLPDLILEVGRTNLFVGQSVTVRVVLPGTQGGMMQSLQQILLRGRGLLVDQGAIRQSMGAVDAGHGNLLGFIYETTITPVESGPLSFFAQGFTSGMHFSGPITIQPGGFQLARMMPTLLESTPVQATARPLPREGRLPGFTGAVGNLALAATSLETNVLRVGDTIRLTATFQCDSNILRLVAPPAPRVPNWQVFAATTNGTLTQQTPTQRAATFAYILIPLSESVAATPPIPFSFFDPDKGLYKDASIPAMAVTVQPGLAPAEVQALIRADRLASEPDKEPVLGSLSASPGRTAATLLPSQQSLSFLLWQIIPAAALTALWLWDRRRRYFELHPGELLRIRAKRALRRERRALREAAHARDADGFANRAISALRVACAPHYPAEPRALVGADILGILPENDRAGGDGQVVRQFFRVLDASRFAVTAADASELLALHPGLEQILTKLEARL